MPMVDWFWAPDMGGLMTVADVGFAGLEKEFLGTGLLAGSDEVAGRGEGATVPVVAHSLVDGRVAARGGGERAGFLCGGFEFLAENALTFQASVQFALQSRTVSGERLAIQNEAPQTGHVQQET